MRPSDILPDDLNEVTVGDLRVGGLMPYGDVAAEDLRHASITDSGTGS
jgi:hypothetical protein